MNILRRKTVTTFLVICVAALLTSSIGGPVKAQEIVPEQTQAVNDTYSNLIMTGWRSNESYYRTADIVGNNSTATRSAWRGSYHVDDFPGDGDILTISYLEGPDTVYQAVWRAGSTASENDDRGYLREIPIVNNVLDWDDATDWSAGITLADAPGSGSIQAQGDVRVGNIVYQTMGKATKVGSGRYL